MRSTMRPIATLVSLLLAAVSALGSFHSHTTPFVDVNRVECAPCAVPALANAEMFVSERFSAPCLHAGQLLFEWPSRRKRNDSDDAKNHCESRYADLRSADFSLAPEESGSGGAATTRMAFTKYKICFFRRPKWQLRFEYRCKSDEDWRSGQMVIGHQGFLSTSQSRLRRWLQRRHPKRSSPIHFDEERYAADVPENASVRTTVLRVHAAHETKAPLYYSMSLPEDARSQNLFTLDTLTGEIRVAKPLDRETLARHVLKVTAYERLDPSVATSTTAVVDVLDVQDNAPVFERNAYFAEIREDTPIGTTVMSVFARDLDEGANGEVHYRLEPYRPQSAADETTTVSEADNGVSKPETAVEAHRLLSINAESGVIQTVAELDRERLSILRVTVVASDRGQPPLSSTALLELSVADVNDNAPRFSGFRRGSSVSAEVSEQLEAEECRVDVPENVSVPAHILTVHAEDADSATNGKVHYSIATSSTAAFAIDYENGALTLREAPDPHHSPLTVLIRAKDGGQPARSVTVACAVHVVDVNDHAPRFIGASANGESGDLAVRREIFVDENAPIGHELGRMFAVDEDSGRNGEIHYYLQDIEALIDSVPPSKKGDENETEAVRIENVFALDRSTGVLKTRVALDREERDSYRFQVIAEDLGQSSRRSAMEVDVRIKDVNDNAPHFPRKHYELTVAENLPRGAELLRVRATDADVSTKLTYRIEHATRPLFTLIDMDEQGAILSLTHQFSASDDRILVVLSATDEGGRQGRCNVSIRVDDVNRPPIFVETPFTVRVPENSRPGFHVLRVHAVDEDRDGNAQLRFGLLDDSEGRFSIDTDSGLITVARPLDREQRAVHFLHVMVSDGGTPPLNASTALEVVLEDVNDNAPRFAAAEYRVAISEDTPVGTSFFQLGATDADEASNAVVDYTFDDSDPYVRLDAFRLDRTSGTVRVNRALDREANASFILPIIATDRGHPTALSARATLTVTLTDVNDNAPLFERRAYDFWIAENQPAGTLVGALTARDADCDRNAEIHFKIFSGLDAKHFDIESDDAAPLQQLPPDAEVRCEEGVNGTVAVVRIRSRDEFDFESPSNKFYIELQASSGQLSSTASITIHVSDVNDNPPQLRDFTVLMAHYMDDDVAGATSDSGDETHPPYVNRTLGAVPAFDADQNATLEYFMERNPLLRLDPFSGVLSLRDEAWRRQVDAEHRVCVTDGPNVACARCRSVHVRLNAALLRDAVTVRVDGLRRAEFLDDEFFRRFRVAVSGAADHWLPEDVRVFGVEERDAEEVEKGVERMKSLARLSVSFFVADEERAESAWRVAEAIVRAERNVSLTLGAPVHLLAAADELCGGSAGAGEPCPYFLRCRASLKHVRGDGETLETDTFLMHSVRTLRTFACECPTGFTTSSRLPGECNTRLDLCYADPCAASNGSCVPLENDYRCDCPPDRTGRHCEFSLSNNGICLPTFCHSGAQCRSSATTSDSVSRDGVKPWRCSGCPWAPPDTDAHCRLHSVSFDGDAYLIVPLAIPRMQWRIDVEFSTVADTATILRADAADHSDFLELSLRGGRPGVELSLGDGVRHAAQLVDWSENRVNDGEWHRLTMVYHERTVRLSVDDCDSEASLLLASSSVTLNASVVRQGHCAVELRVELPRRCDADAALPCHRFLDLPPFVFLGGRPRFERTSSGGGGALVERGFVGCIRDLQLDARLFHFSDFDALARVGNIASGCRAFRPDRCSHSDPCHASTLRWRHATSTNDSTSSSSSSTAHCEDKWLGHLCRCAQRVHSEHGRCELYAANHYAHQSLSFAENSHAVWRLMDAFRTPFTLHFEFRTSQRTTQLMAMEFSVAAQILIVALESGRAMVRFNAAEYLLPYPPLADGVWHSVDVELSADSVALNLTVDHLYKKQISSGSSATALTATDRLSAPQALYTGVAASTAHPHPFIGCIRNVELSGTRLRIRAQSHTRPGCVADGLAAGVDVCGTCPPGRSRCMERGGHHTCECLPGYAGDSCVDVCTIAGICGAGGTCVRRAFVNRSAAGEAVFAATAAYDCICSPGRIGRNCEQSTLPAICPKNWYGTFPSCRPCECDASRGFLPQCHPSTGQCQCAGGTYRRQRLSAGAAAECVLCDCGVGALNGTQCDPANGQCQCGGEAGGRRCDECSLGDAERWRLDAITLKCVRAKRDGCDADVAYGIRWPASSHGALVRQPCPLQQLGTAGRHCGSDGEWSPVYTHNCTLNALVELAERLADGDDAIATSWVAHRLLVATANRPQLRWLGARNFDVVLDALRYLADRINGQPDGHVDASAKVRSAMYPLRDPTTTRGVLQVVDRLLSVGSDEDALMLTDRQFRHLLVTLYRFGAALSSAQAAVGALRMKPLRYVGEMLLFVIDVSDDFSSFSLPKYDNLFATTAQHYRRTLTAPTDEEAANYRSRQHGFASFRIRAAARRHDVVDSADATVVFYMLVRAPRGATRSATACRHCRFAAPILGIHYSVVAPTTAAETERVLANASISTRFRQHFADSTSDLQFEIDHLHPTPFPQKLDVEFPLVVDDASSTTYDDESMWQYAECTRLSTPIRRWHNASFSTPDRPDDDKDLEWIGDGTSVTGTNATHAECRFQMAPQGTMPAEQGGLFAVMARIDDVDDEASGAFLWNLSFFDDTRLGGGGEQLAGAIAYAAPLSAAFTLFLCAASMCAALLRHAIRTRFIRCALIGAFFLNASIFFVLQRASVTSALCPLRNGALTLATSALFAWCFVYAFHTYRLLATGTTESCFSISTLAGVAAPALLSAVAYSTTPSTAFACRATSRTIWLVAGPPLLYAAFAFYAIGASTLVSMHKQYQFLLAKYAVRRSLLNHFILLILCAGFNAVAAYDVFHVRHRQSRFTLMLRLASTFLTSAIGIHIFIWMNFFGERTSSANSEEDVKSAQTLWVDDRAAVVTTGATANDGVSTKKKSIVGGKTLKDGKVYAGVPNEWVPDAVAPQTYVHHTLQRAASRNAGNGTLMRPTMIAEDRGGRMTAVDASPPPGYHAANAGGGQERQPLYTRTMQRSSGNNNADEDPYFPSITPYSTSSAASASSRIYASSTLSRRGGAVCAAAALPQNNNYANTMAARGVHYGNDTYAVLHHQRTSSNQRCEFGAQRSPLLTARAGNGTASSNDGAVDHGITVASASTLPFLRSAHYDDQLNDAYYTYTAKKSGVGGGGAQSPATTFN